MTDFNLDILKRPPRDLAYKLELGTSGHRWYLIKDHDSSQTIFKEISLKEVVHCATEPAIYTPRSDTVYKWVLDDIHYSFDEWCNLTNKTANERLLLEIEYDCD
jgi:hypothetical protein